MFILHASSTFELWRHILNKIKELLQKFLFWIPMELKLHTHVQCHQLKNRMKLQKITSIYISDSVKLIEKI